MELEDRKYIKEQLVPLIQQVKEEKPSEHEHAIDFYHLCIEEIEEGGSLEHEVQLAITSIKDLLKED